MDTYNLYEHFQPILLTSLQLVSYNGGVSCTLIQEEKMIVDKQSEVLTETEMVTPGACMWCDREERTHSIEWNDVVGYHNWIAPTTEQRKQRILAGRKGVRRSS